MPAKRHLVTALLAVSCLGVGIGTVGVARAQTEPGASIDKVGWWNTTRGPQPGEPDNPVRPALAPVPAPPTNVPVDSVGVGAAAGEPSKVAAVGILVSADPGSTASALTLTVKESVAPGANVGTDQAAIVACPITGFWGETRNGSWVDRPTADCTLGSAKGTRAADGTWTFDLAALAPLWLDDGGPGQNGVLLMEAIDAPGGFEASFPDPSAGGMTLTFSASGGAGAAGGVDSSSPPADGFSLPPLDAGAASGTADLGRTDPFSLAPGAAAPPTSPSASPSPAASSPPAGRATAGRAPAPGAGRAGDLVGNVSPATLLLIPVALALALVLSLALGDAVVESPQQGSAAPGRRRLGGVSRALARRERAALPSPMEQP